MDDMILPAMLIVAFCAYVIGKIAEHMQRKLHLTEVKLVQKPNTERPPPAAIRPLRQTIQPPTAPMHDTSGFKDGQVPQPARASAETAPVKAWVAEWRRAVVLLARWGGRNVSDARLRLEIGDCRSASETAVTGVERMSRALLRCFGEKADIEAGQTEPLKLVSLRLTREERAKFEVAIEAVEKIHQNTKAQNFLLAHKTDVDVSLLDTEQTKALLDSASNIVTLFAKILHEHFAVEIPELRECCPKCFSLDVALFGFNQSTESCTCRLCGHRWTRSPEVEARTGSL